MPEVPSNQQEFPPDLVPSELILARCRAFAAGDFAFVYDSYHPDSHFRRLFPDREAYLEYARSSLGRDFRIRGCVILREEICPKEARAIYYLDITFQGDRLESFELAHFRRTAGRWYYFSTQKLERREFPGEIEQIDWSDFERVKDKLIF